MATATAASALSTLVSMLLSFILPISMFTYTLNPGEIATITSTLTGTNANTGVEEVYGIETVFYRTNENELNASFTTNGNGVKSGIAFKDEQLHLIRGEGSSTVQEYIDRMKRAVENGLATYSDLSEYEDLLALEPVLSYLVNGHLKEDVETMLPWLKGKMPTIEQMLGLRTTTLDNYRTQYNFTLHLRDLPTMAINLVLRSLASSSFRASISSLHVWDMVEDAPNNPADYLMLAVGSSDLDLEDLPALTLPVELVLAADGTVESFSAETVYYERYDYTEMEINYANGQLHAAIRPYRMQNTAPIPLGVYEVNASVTQNGGSIDVNFAQDDASSHFFVNYQLLGGKLWSADAQYTVVDYDSCTASLSYRPNNLIVTLLADDSVMTGELRWAMTQDMLHYWLDASAGDAYYGEGYLISANGNARWQDQFNHDFQLSITELEQDEYIKMNFNQKLVHEGNTYTHDITGTVTETRNSGSETVTVPVSWNTLITLK